MISSRVRLKIVSSLSREVCVACAGDRAEEAFASIRHLNRADGGAATVEPYLQDAATAVGGANEFLVGSVGDVISLSRVTSQGIQREPEMQRIGDPGRSTRFSGTDSANGRWSS